MSRQPTPQEIKQTNSNLTKQCDRCDLLVRADANYGTFENMLTLTMSGGYNEYVDVIDPSSPEFEFTLCHKCAHKLMAQFFSQWATQGWHPRTTDKYCDGWTMPTWEAVMEP